MIRRQKLLAILMSISTIDRIITRESPDPYLEWIGDKVVIGNPMTIQASNARE